MQNSFFASVELEGVQKTDNYKAFLNRFYIFDIFSYILFCQKLEFTSPNIFSTRGKNVSNLNYLISQNSEL